MKAPITTAQAMNHPDVVLTINTLGKMADELRAEIDELRARNSFLQGQLEGADLLLKERDALKADAERLTWLEKDMRRIPSGDGGYLHELNFSYFVSLQRLTLRHAIDRAMKGTS